jgi:hypothetical protein
VAKRNASLQASDPAPRIWQNPVLDCKTEPRPPPPRCPEDPQRLSDGGYPLDQLGSSPVRVLRTPADQGGSQGAESKEPCGSLALCTLYGTTLELAAVTPCPAMDAGRSLCSQPAPEALAFIARDVLDWLTNWAAHRGGSVGKR